MLALGPGFRVSSFFCFWFRVKGLGPLNPKPKDHGLPYNPPLLHPQKFLLNSSYSGIVRPKYVYLRGPMKIAESRCYS